MLQETSIDDQFITEQTYIDSGDYVYNLNMSADGTIISEISKRLISESLKAGYANGTITPTKTTSIDVHDLDGKFIETFNSVIEASESLVVSCNQIQKVLGGRQKHTHRLQFKRSDDDKIVTKLLLNSIGNSRIKKVKAKSRKHKPCELTNVKTNEVIQFNSLKDCAEHLGTKSTALWKAMTRYKRPFRNTYIIKYTIASQ